MKKELTINDIRRILVLLGIFGYEKKLCEYQIPGLEFLTEVGIIAKKDKENIRQRYMRWKLKKEKLNKKEERI